MLGCWWRNGERVGVEVEGMEEGVFCEFRGGNGGRGCWGAGGRTGGRGLEVMEEGGVGVLV